MRMRKRKTPAGPGGGLLPSFQKCLSHQYDIRIQADEAGIFRRPDCPLYLPGIDSWRPHSLIDIDTRIGKPGALDRWTVSRNVEALWRESCQIQDRHPKFMAAGLESDGLRSDGAGRILVRISARSAPLADVLVIERDGAWWLIGGALRPGLFGRVGTMRRRRLILATSLLSALTIRRAVRTVVAVSFAKWNLEPAALAVRKRWPRAEIIFAADGGFNGANNPGMSPAADVARSIGARLAFPAWHADWNWLMCSGGLTAVRENLENGLPLRARLVRS